MLKKSIALGFTLGFAFFVMQSAKTYLNAAAGNKVVASELQGIIPSQVLTNSPHYSRTIAQIDAITPTGVGQLVYCSDCVRTTICTSTGTGRGAFSVLVSTASWPVASAIHCQ